MTTYPRICAVLDVPALENAGDGTYLNEEQLSVMEQTLEDANGSLINYDTAMSQLEQARQVNLEQEERITQLSASVSQAESERDAARTELETAHADLEASRETGRIAAETLARLTALLDAIDPSVASAAVPEAKASAIRSLLSRMPGAGIAGILDKGDPAPSSDGVNWELINSLPHNLDIDKNL